MTIEENKVDYIGEVNVVFTDKQCQLGLCIGPDVQIKGPPAMLGIFYKVGKQLRITIREIEKENK